MFVRFKDNGKTSMNGNPMYNGDILHNGEKYQFQDYSPSFSSFDKNSWRTQKDLMKKEIVEFFKNSKFLFKKISP